MEQIKPKFYVLYKNFNNGQVEKYDVLAPLFAEILTDKGTISKKNFRYVDNTTLKFMPITNKKEFENFLKNHFIYHYWAKCEWEFIIIDWPCRDTIDQSRPHKIDVYEQLKPNLPLITDIVWNYIEPKLEKLK